jgi:purine-binding chemotaxis protein CheW
MSVEVKTGALLDQQLALSAYLEALLGDTAVPPAVADTPVSMTVAAPAEAPAVLVPTSLPPAAVEATPAVVSPPRVQADTRPEWGRVEFQSLLFQVAGLTLAVPLAKLNGVMPLDLASVTPMPGHSALFPGLIDHLGQQVRVVDTAQVVLPPERLQAGGAAAGRVSHLVLIGEGRWGLAASGIGQVVSLRPEDVKWRGSQGKRPWLAGTVIHHMCALLEVDAFLELLGEGRPGGGVA